MRSDQTKFWRNRRVLVVGAIVIGVLICLLFILAGRSIFRGTDSEQAYALFTVAEGPLTISVAEAGVIQPADKRVIKSEVEGSATILYLVPEGIHVDEGDLLVELDASTLKDRQVDQEVSVQNADASLVQAKGNLEVTRNQAESNIEQAELDFKFAKEDLQKYIEGEYPNQVKELESKITLAEEELRRVQETLGWSEKLYEKKYLSESELVADRLAVKKGELNLELARNDLALLQQWTHTRKLDELRSAVKQAEMALARTKTKAHADIVQAEAQFKARDAQFNQEKSKLQKIRDQIGKARITAPAAGIVVHATSAEASRPWRSQEPLDEGQQVRERQELIHLLPSETGFIADVSIHESSLEKVRRGLPVRLTVDALPGRAFNGTVTSIAPLADPQSMFMNPDLKVYKTQIRVEDGTSELRSGMNCRAEIIVEHFPSAVYVPVQAVVRVKGQSTAFVMTSGGIRPRPVEIGMDNNRMVRVISGLTSGERVLLNPPLDAAAVSPEGHVPAHPMPSSDDAESQVSDVPPAGGASSDDGGGSREAEAVSEGAVPSERRGSNGTRLSDEERQKLRERFQSMSAEERAEFMRNRRQREQ